MIDNEIDAYNQLLEKFDKMIAVLERIAEAIEEEIAMAQAEENNEQ